MIRVNQLKLPYRHNREQLLQKILHILQLQRQDLVDYQIVRQSIDARKKPDIYYIYSIDVEVKNERRILEAAQRRKGLKEQILEVEVQKYQFPTSGVEEMKYPPVVIGAGPAGLFCAYYLAKAGYQPILLERGKSVDQRNLDVLKFWETGILNPNSNVQFGEGGAGTFSDGKLNTLVKDKNGRNREVLQTFVQFGARESILYDAKPHIGTDVLCSIVKEMRQKLISLGGRVYFESQVTDISVEAGAITGVYVNGKDFLSCNQVVLAIGHSARDTFSMLYEKHIPMEAKAFAVGLRVEHPQEWINESQYGMKGTDSLGAAPYKVTAKASNGRGVYSFCMCPGGFVVNASSEEGRLAINGMSYSNRDSRNANSAVIVSVTPEDFGEDHPLAGIAFQRGLEEKAYKLGKGKIPAQRYGDYKESVTGKQVPGREDEIIPCTKGDYAWADLSTLLPKECSEAFVEGMETFSKQIQDFNHPNAVLLGVESRTSSPVRIVRDENLQSSVRGLYPCGEGAGYAGGITSAAMDGLRVAEMIASQYAPRFASESFV